MKEHFPKNPPVRRSVIFPAFYGFSSEILWRDCKYREEEDVLQCNKYIKKSHIWGGHIFLPLIDHGSLKARNGNLSYIAL